MMLFDSAEKWQRNRRQRELPVPQMEACRKPSTYPWPSRSGKLELNILSIRKMESFFPSLNVVFVAINFQVSRLDTGKSHPRLVGQFGMATVDT
jgi:hypothetical protein